MGFGVRAAIAGATLVFLALRLDETLPKSKRRPFNLSSVNPLGAPTRPSASRPFPNPRFDLDLYDSTQSSA